MCGKQLKKKSQKAYLYLWITPKQSIAWFQIDLYISPAQGAIMQRRLNKAAQQPGNIKYNTEPGVFILQ